MAHHAESTGAGQSTGEKAGGAGAKSKGKYTNCGMAGYKPKDRTKGTQSPVGDVDQKPPRDQPKAGW